MDERIKKGNLARIKSTYKSGLPSRLKNSIVLISYLYIQSVPEYSLASVQVNEEQQDRLNINASDWKVFLEDLRAF